MEKLHGNGRSLTNQQYITQLQFSGDIKIAKTRIIKLFYLADFPFVFKHQIRLTSTCLEF